MKCDELKSLKNIEIAFNTTTQQEQVIAEDSEGNCYGFDSWEEVYLKSDVDKVIAEKDKKIRRLYRALYKTCANWAHIAVAFFSSYVTKNRWRWMELKCLKKAEEYK